MGENGRKVDASERIQYLGQKEDLAASEMQDWRRNSEQKTMVNCVDSENAGRLLGRDSPRFRVRMGWEWPGAMQLRKCPTWD